MEKEKIAEKIPWWTILLVTILPFIGGASTFFFKQRDSGITNLGKLVYLHYFPAAPVLLFFFLAIINMKAPRKFRLSAATSAYLYAAVAIAAFSGNPNVPQHTFSRLLGARYVDQYKLVAQHMPPWWMISKDAASAFLEPSPVSPEWGPVILYWWAFGASLWFLIAGLSVFLRHQWYDVENLTYPYAQVALDTIHTAREPSRPQTKKLLIGALVGILVYFPYIMRMFFPWIPDVYGWSNTQTHDDYLALKLDVVFPAIFKSAVGLTNLSYNPLYIALAYFIPLNTLFSAAFFYGVYILIGTQIVWYMGYYTGIENVASGTRADMLRHQAPINVTGLIEHGVLPMILVMAILLNWRTVIVKPLRLALGTGAESERADERKEPVSYRTALIIIIASAVIILLLLTVSGFSVDDALIFLAVPCMLYQLSYARTRGYAGPIPVGDRLGPMFFRWKYPSVTIGNVPKSFYLFGQSSHFVTDANAAFGGTAFPIFETLRVGTDLGVDYRGLFKVMCIAGLIAPLFGMLGFTLVGQAIGLNRTATPGLSDYSTYGGPSYVYTRPSPPHVWPWIVSGALLTVFLSYMRFRFVWWPLDPVGVFIGAGGPAVKIGLGWVFIIAFVLKYVTLKVGGSKLFTETGAPFVTGFIAGSAMISLIGALTGTMIFLKPI